jgi:phosphatidylserine/phosphatidylglycerophosphate/cardiolipin synthase-like enzyme
MIISPWIRSSVVNKDFISKLEALLRNRVDVYIGYGIGDGRVDPSAVAKLKRLSERYKEFRFKDFGNTHAKLLLCDREFVCLGSFNWLSFRGDPNSTFRDEQSLLTSIVDVIDSKFNEQLQNFQANY